MRALQNHVKLSEKADSCSQKYEKKISQKLTSTFQDHMETNEKIPRAIEK
jgi:uncharacterized protein (UPF0210 family)